MSKASERKLNALHGAVAEVLTSQVLHEEAETTFDEDGNLVETGEVKFSASPALLATATKFLKDNLISCDVENDENMSNLRDVLAKKQKRSRLGDASAAATSVDQYSH